MKKKVFITLFVVLILIIGNQLTVPGIKPLLDSDNQSWLLGFGSGLTWFTLGISPYIFANIATSILTSGISPFFSNLKKKYGNDHIILFLIRTIIALIFAFALGNEFKNMAVKSLAYTVTGTDTKVVICLTIGTLICILLSRLIDKKGIGQGTSLILLFTISSSLIKSFVKYILNIDLSLKAVAMFIISIILLILFIFFMLFYCHLSKEIPIDDENADIKSDKSVITIPYNSAGLTPIFVSSIALSVIASIIELNQTIHSIIYYVIFAILILIVSYKNISPKKRSKDMMVKGLMIKGVVPGKDTEKYLKRVVGFTAIKSICFLIFVEMGLGLVKMYFEPLSTLSMPTLLLFGMCLYQLIISLKTLMLENKEIELLY